MQNYNKKCFPSFMGISILLVISLYIISIPHIGLNIGSLNVSITFRWNSYTPIICIEVFINVIVLSEAKWDLGNFKSPSYVKWMFKTFIQRITWLVDQAQSLPCCFCGGTMYKEAVRRQRTLLLVFISVHIFRYVINVVYIWLPSNFHIPIF